MDALRFALKELIFCDSCDAALSYIPQDDKTFIVQHPRNGCQRAGQRFVGPTIELTLIEDSDASH